MDQDKLIGWLCILRLQFGKSEAFYLPHAVRHEMERRGWIEVGDADWDGNHRAGLTNKGMALSDLQAPEWGIDSVPAETD